LFLVAHLAMVQLPEVLGTSPPGNAVYVL
jgi:hypothetical protein